MYGMYIINGVHGPESRSLGGNTSTNPQVSALILRPAFNGIERMYQCHGSNQKSNPPVLFRNPLCDQFIHYHISGRGVFWYQSFQIIKNVFATVDRGSIIVRIHRWSVMNYGSLQAVFMETKYKSHIHRFGTSIFGKLVVDTSKSMNNNNQILWKL